MTNTKRVKKPKQKSVRFKHNKTVKYIPSIDKKMRTSMTKTKRRDLFECEKQDQVKIKVKKVKRKKGKKKKIKKKTYRCVNADSKKGKNQLVRFLNRPRTANCVTAPNQMLKNCWFNTMFMSMFISDKGLLFSKPLRQVMITGKRLNGTSIHKKLKQPFSKLNMAIQASVDCNNDRFYLLSDTNFIIREIYRSLHGEKTSYKEEFAEDVHQEDEYGNPIGYYIFIVDYLLEGNNTKKRIQDHSMRYMNDTLGKMTLANQNKRRTDVYFVVLDFDEEDFSDWYFKGKHIKNRTINVGTSTYVLDSMIISNDEHFISFHTINGKEYGFDGASQSKLQPMPWKNRINKDEDFNLNNNANVGLWSFNFMKGYQIMVFFRTN